jgi:hypothetical protein
MSKHFHRNGLIPIGPLQTCRLTDPQRKASLEAMVERGEKTTRTCRDSEAQESGSCHPCKFPAQTVCPRRRVTKGSGEDLVHSVCRCLGSAPRLEPDISVESSNLIELSTEDCPPHRLSLLTGPPIAPLVYPVLENPIREASERRRPSISSELANYMP